MSAVVRKSILISLLMLAASAFAYDQLVVKRKPIRIQAELMDLVNDTSHTYTEEEILAMVDRPGETIYESRQKKIIKFQWQGLSSSAHELFIVFRKFRGTTLISDVSLSEPSASKPFITSSDVANSDGVEDPGVAVPNGIVPPPSNQRPRGGLVEGG
jgi:hypothetical protein